MSNLRERIYRSPALAARLRRYHGWPVLHTQTIGEHCARVANIYISVFGLPRAEVLYYILNHDAGELLAGDVPFGGKDKVPGFRAAITEAEALGLQLLELELPKLEKLECVRVKIADLLEMYEFGRLEELMGNSLAAPITKDTLAEALRRANESCQTSIVKEWLAKQQRDTI